MKKSSSNKRIRLQTLFSQFHAVLGIYLTNKCNALCAHCATNSSPRERNEFKLDELVAETLLPKRLDGVVALHVSGGEPFMWPRALEQIDAIAKRRGLLFAVNSNAFWATSLERAERVLRTLPNLTHLLLSTDVYHEPFVPMDRIKYAAMIALNRGLSVDVAICSADPKRCGTAEHLRALLGSELYNEINVFTTPLEKGGRADNLADAHHRALTERMPAGSCRLINRPVILQDGRVIACCNTVVVEGQSHRSPLVLGTLGRSSLEQMQKRAKADPLIQAIRTKGPRYVAEKLEQHGVIGQPLGPYLDGDICDLCNKLMTRVPSEELRAAVETKQVRQEVAVARAAEFGEAEALVELLR